VDGALTWLWLDILPRLQAREDVKGDTGAGRRVAVLFSHQLFPGRRFGHRFPPPSSMTARDAPIWLKEEIETGALHRMMTDPPVSDEAGILWTTW
jgi:hypothetical protein